MTYFVKKYALTALLLTLAFNANAKPIDGYTTEEVAMFKSHLVAADKRCGKISYVRELHLASTMPDDELAIAVWGVSCSPYDRYYFLFVTSDHRVVIENR